jgi:hypothetical protein
MVLSEGKPTHHVTSNCARANGISRHVSKRDARAHVRSKR